MKLSIIFTVLLAVTLIHLNAEEEKKATKEKSTPLFDGKTLKGWEVCNYAGIGEIKVIPKNNSLLINRGEILSGVKLSEFDKLKLPTVNYEISLEGRRVEGDDFFCCLTFPYKKSHATFVLGGWGGSVCGISSIDFMDAMENSTMSVMDFAKAKWYKVRLIVTENRFQGFVGKKRRFLLYSIITKYIIVDFRKILRTNKKILSDFLSTYLGHVCTRSTNAIGILVFVVNLRIFQTQLVG